MKVAIVTWNSYNNIGTHLQAYALQQYMNKNNIDNLIINDSYFIDKNNIKNDISQPNTIVESRYVRFLKKYLFHPARFISDIKPHLDVYRYNNSIQNINNSVKFIKKFKEDYLSIYTPDTSDLINDLNSAFDVFVCGSDQIWSLTDRNFNGYYYLNFTSKKKIAYAPSMGTKNIPENRSIIIKNWLSDFSAISVRERQTASTLSNLLDKEIDFVSDPTLLHNKEFWSNFCTNINIKDKKYILCYFLSDNPWYFEYAKMLSKYLKLKLILIPNKVEFADKKYLYRSPVGPKEFAALIKNSEFVLTDSYHATIFSLIFEKYFLHLKRFNDNEIFCQNIRIESLLNYLELDDCIINKKSFSKDDLCFFDYDKVNLSLNCLIQKSSDFLMENLIV